MGQRHLSHESQIGESNPVSPAYKAGASPHLRIWQGGRGGGRTHRAVTPTTVSNRAASPVAALPESEWRESNPRSPGPKPGALPNYATLSWWRVGELHPWLMVMSHLCCYYTNPRRGGCSPQGCAPLQRDMAVPVESHRQPLVAQAGIEPAHLALSERCRNHLATGLGEEGWTPTCSGQRLAFLKGTHYQAVNMPETPDGLEPPYGGLQPPA